MSDALTAGKVGVIAYTLRDDRNKVLDSSKRGSPLAYLHGHDNIVTGLEKALEGKEAGDAFTVDIAPADGYGERTGKPQLVPRREFPKNVELRKGMPLRMEGSNGEEVVVWVHDIRGSRVALHTDHPLAGETLHFEVEVLAVRDATSEELAHGHAHGPSGHAHHH